MAIEGCQQTGSMGEGASCCLAASLVRQETLPRRYQQRFPQFPLPTAGFHVLASAARNAGKARIGHLHPPSSGGEPRPQEGGGGVAFEPTTYGVGSSSDDCEDQMVLCI